MHLTRKISLLSLGKLLTALVFTDLRHGQNFGILVQRGIAIFDCEAAALPGRFLPELGRSPERPFFWPGLLLPAFVARALMDVMSTLVARSCAGTKIPGPKITL
jgi:hypothetical protein